MNTIWAARLQALYLCVIERPNIELSSTGGFLLLSDYSILQALDPPASACLFNAVRLGRQPGVCTTWNEAKAQSERVHNDVRKFNSRKKAEASLVEGWSAGDRTLLQPDADIFRNASASLTTDLAGWEVHVIFSYCSIVRWLNIGDLSSRALATQTGLGESGTLCGWTLQPHTGF